jgi:hypothetical protein
VLGGEGGTRFTDSAVLDIPKEVIFEEELQLDGA